MSINTATLVENVETVEVDDQPKVSSSVITENDVNIDTGGAIVTVKQTTEDVIITDPSVKVVDRINESSVDIVLKVDGAATWTPLQLTLSGWYDASDETTITDSDGSVLQWDDKSTSGNDLGQIDGARQPTTGTRSLNGLNVLDFNDDVLTTTITPISLSSTGVTIFIVAKFENLSGSTFRGGLEILPDGLDINKGINFFNDRNIDFRARRGPSPFLDGVFSPSDTDDHVFGLSYSNTLSSIYLDGTKGTDSTGTKDRTVQNVYVGGLQGLASVTNLDGYIAEVFIAPSILSDSDRQKSEGYLAHKWGLEDNLPVSHPYKSAPPTV